jgi:hypothetical protein
MSRESPLHGSDHEQAQATPLDILLNAIQGSNGSYPYTQHDDHDHPPTLNSEDLNLDGLLHDQDQAVEVSWCMQTCELTSRPRGNVPEKMNI